MEAGAAEVLAYMYDRSLDIFAQHYPANPRSLYWRRSYPAPQQSSLGQAQPQQIFDNTGLPAYPDFHADALKFYDNYGIGGPGGR